MPDHYFLSCVYAVISITAQTAPFIHSTLNSSLSTLFQDFCKRFPDPFPGQQRLRKGVAVAADLDQQ